MTDISTHTHSEKKPSRKGTEEHGHDQPTAIIADKAAIEEQARSVMEMHERGKKEIQNDIAALRNTIESKRGRGKTVAEVVRSQLSDDAKTEDVIAAINAQARQAVEDVAAAAGMKVEAEIHLTRKQVGILGAVAFLAGIGGGIGGTVLYSRRKARLENSDSASSSPSTET